MNSIKPLISRCIHFLQYLYGVLFSRGPFYKNVHKWFACDGNNKYLLNYNLNEDSVVFEVGGYTGVFSDSTIAKFNCNLYIFEPIQEYYNILIGKYKNNTKIHIYNFGLGNENKTIELGLLNDGTSAYKSGNTETVQIKKLSEFLTSNSIGHIDLISINIEGGEYDLLEDITSTEIIKNMKYIQIQFHDFVENSDLLRKNRIENILKTHKKTYSFPFVWEGFIRNPDIAGSPQK